MRASVLSADAFSMSSVIRRVPSREDKTVAARGARDLLRAYDADPASVSLEQPVWTAADGAVPYLAVGATDMAILRPR